jgi:hypothetical protein
MVEPRPSRVNERRLTRCLPIPMRHQWYNLFPGSSVGSPEKPCISERGLVSDACGSPPGTPSSDARNSPMLPHCVHSSGFLALSRCAERDGVSVFSASLDSVGRTPPCCASRLVMVVPFLNLAACRCARLMVPLDRVRFPQQHSPDAELAGCGALSPRGASETIGWRPCSMGHRAQRCLSTELPYA